MAAEVHVSRHPLLLHRLSQLRDQAISFLVQQSELQQEATKMGVKVTQQDVDKQVEKIKKTYYKGS